MGNYEEDVNIDEIKELIVKYFRLQEQIDKPTRDGMIKALSDAQSIARDEIAALEEGGDDIDPMPWDDFEDNDLYSKLPQYKQGLYNYAVSRVGEETFKYLLEECI